MSASLTRACALVLAASLGACGGGQTRLNLFSTDWQDDGGASIARVWQKLSSNPVSAGVDIVIGIGGAGDRLVGLPLSGGTKWTLVHPLQTRPVVAGRVVVGAGAGEAFALDAMTGNVIWKRPTGDIEFLGAGDDGAVTVAAFRRPGGSGSTLLAVTHEGQVVRQIETEKPLGAPAVIDRMAFVPWAGQYVSVIDLSNGDEAARVTLREETSRAWTEGGSLWFGQVGFTHFDEHTRDASKGHASRVTIKAHPLPGGPRLMRPGSEPVPALANAEDKVHLYARPAMSETGAGVEDGRFYATYFRMALGFDADSGKIAWVHVNRADFVNAAAEGGGIVLCDEKGNSTELDAKTGGLVSQEDLGEPVKACIVHVDAKRAGGAAADAGPLASQLAAAVLVEDPQLVAMQSVLLGELANVTEETATKALVDLASDPRTSPALLGAARGALSKRRNGASYMAAALARHYDFMKDVLLPPPVGPLAQALGAMKERAAAPLLAAHLLDPADTEDDVMKAAAALAVMATPAELPTLRQFFAMYRGNAQSDDMVAAVVSVAQALIAFDGTAGRVRVETAARDSMTTGDVRDRLGQVLAPKAPPPVKEAAQKAK